MSTIFKGMLEAAFEGRIGSSVWYFQPVLYYNKDITDKAGLTRKESSCHMAQFYRLPRLQWKRVT